MKFSRKVALAIRKEVKCKRVGMWYCSPKILEAARKSRYDYYLLTDIDIPWQKDDLRDRPNDRKNTFKFFKTKNNLIKYKIKNNNNKLLYITFIIKIKIQFN